MKNPFSIGILQDEDEFCDREKERASLVQHANNGDNIVIFSPRRFGKSSLVTIVQSELRRRGFLTAYVDLFPIASEEDVITRFASAIYRGIGRGADPRSLMERFKDLFRSVRPLVEIGPDGYSISAKYDRMTASPPPLDDLLEGLHAYIKRTNTKACVVLDEFQEITELPDAKRIEGIFRSHLQFQDDVSYFFVGSRRRILKDMFANKARPFYKSAFFFELQEISASDFVPYIQSRFDSAGKSCKQSVAELLYQKPQGYPYYVQKLSSMAWNATDMECTEEIVEQSFKQMIASEAMDFEGIWSGLSLMQKTVLKALAKKPTSAPYAREYLETSKLTLGGTQKALKTLLEKDVIEKTPDGTYRLTDPIMVHWLMDVNEGSVVNSTDLPR